MYLKKPKNHQRTVPAISQKIRNVITVLLKRRELNYEVHFCGGIIIEVG